MAENKLVIPFIVLYISHFAVSFFSTICVRVSVTQPNHNKIKVLWPGLVTFWYLLRHCHVVLNAILVELVHDTGATCKKGRIKIWPSSLSVVYQLSYIIVYFFNL